MKNPSLLLLSLFLFQSCGVFENEQNDIEGCPFVLDVAETMPQLNGGLAELQRRVVYPQEALENSIEGRVTIGFIVNKEGIPIEPRLIRGIGYGTYEASKKAVLESTFRNGEQDGEPVCINYSLPIVFRLQN
ncbi:MAG: energy transducer TonB [Balneola sp.]